jgi:uncharacterized protein YoxC
MNKNNKHNEPIQPTITAHITMSVEQLYIQTLLNEKQQLYNENIDLRERILNLSKNEEILQEIIKGNEQTIEALRKENEELKNRLKELEEKLNNITKEHNELKIEHNKLKEDINTMKQKEQYKKYITAIQDINRLISLENKKYYNYDIKKNLEKLRNDRNYDSHYILEDNDNDDIKNDKRIILVEQLDSMPNEIKNRFNKKYPKLLENIIGYIEPNNNTISSKENEEEVREWWTE